MSDKEKKISVTEEELKEVASGIDITDPIYKSYIPCPGCWNLIPVSMYVYLLEGELTCPHCRMKFDISTKEKSAQYRQKMWEEWEKRQKAKEQ